MPAEQIADAFLIRPRALAQKMVERHQDAGRAEAALQGMIAFQRRLQNAETVRRGRQSFHGAKLAAFDLRGQRQAGARRHAVNCDGAGAAHAMLAADMGAGGADLVREVLQ